MFRAVRLKNLRPPGALDPVFPLSQETADGRYPALFETLKEGFGAGSFFLDIIPRTA